MCIVGREGKVYNSPVFLVHYERRGWAKKARVLASCSLFRSILVQLAVSSREPHVPLFGDRLAVVGTSGALHHSRT